MSGRNNPKLTSVPLNFSARSSGNVAFDDQYFYVKYDGWRRFPLVQLSSFPFSFPPPSNNGDIYTDNEYFYIVVNGQWKRFPIAIIKPLLFIGWNVSVMNIQDAKLSTFPRSYDNYGTWGMISFNAEYFCIWGQGKWHKTPIVRMPQSLFS